ncbi:hypothetical protein OROGR_012773 [Orobanche gracilis]
MGSNGGEQLSMTGNDMAECSETTVEIKIKTLDSQTFTLRVDKYVPVPQLKEQIASLTGVLSEQQRLICRGKVLKDDQRLSAYHVEDGHTLHLIVRQPVVPSPDIFDHPATDPTSGTGHNPGAEVGPDVMVGTFDISEQADGAFPDLNRIVSAVLNSFGVTRSGSGGEGIDLNQPFERLSTVPGLSGTRNYRRVQSDQTSPEAIPVESLQPPIIPDSLTTLLQYSSHLRREFLANAGWQNADAQHAAASGSDGLGAAVPFSGPRGLLTPESLAEVMSSARQLLVEQATECLLQLAGQLQSQSSVMDPLERSRIQSSAMRSGALFQNLGALLLELGRTIMTLRMGQTPADALVNAGPSVFVSSTGPNPIMVQPMPFQPGTSFGSVPIGTVQHGSGLAGGSSGTSFLPRNIDIRIRTGSLLSRREPISSQPVGQGAPPLSSSSRNSGPQDAAAAATLSDLPPQVRTISLGTVVAPVPPSVERAESSRGPIGILYPVLARVQHAASGNSGGTRAFHDPNGNTQEPGSDSAIQQQYFVVPEGSGSLPPEAFNGQGFSDHIRGGLEQLLSTIFPGEHVLSTRGSGSVPLPSHNTEAAAAHDIGGSSTREPASADASDEGIILSNILRQIMPFISENSTPSDEGGANLDETQADGNTEDGLSSRNSRDHQSQPTSKRQKRE